MVEAIARALAKESYRGYMAALIDHDLDVDTEGESEESYVEEYWRNWIQEATEAIPPMFQNQEPDWEV